MRFLKSLLVVVFFLNHSEALESDDECGHADDTAGLIVDGIQVKPFEWPWTVAIFHKVDGVNLRFICGGTLITRRKVITAAHCLHEKYDSNEKKVDDMLLKLGAFDISKSEEGVIDEVPESFTIHPDWQPNVLRYDADIAVLELPFNVNISKFIRPICIWERRRGSPGFTTGTVVGWGQKDQQILSHENIARKVTIPVINNEECFLDQRSFAALSSNRTFCGGAKNGQGPCKGDSGSGLFFESESKFYLGGIVSASAVDIFKNCDVKNYAVYTDVFKFNLWLSNKKFREKSQSEAACDRYRSERPKRPSWFKSSKLESNEAEIGEYPHSALLGYKHLIGNISYNCNGFLLSEQFVLTAAHCLRKDILHVRFGAVSERDLDDQGKPIAVDIKIKKLLPHEKYSAKTKQHDIALILLEHPAKLSYFVWPACLYQQLDVSSKIWIATSRQNIEIIETGETFKPYFLKVPVQEDDASCLEFFEENEINITKEQFCVKSVITNIALCQGSSGAPFQVSIGGFNYVGGISSFGPLCMTSSLTVSPRIASYIEWIEERVWPDEDEKEILIDDRENQESTTKLPAVKSTSKPAVDTFVFPVD